MRRSNGSPSYITCDEVLVAVALCPDVVTSSSSQYVTVELKGEFSRGQMCVDWRRHLGKSANVTLVTDINKVVYMSLLKKSLSHPVQEASAILSQLLVSIVIFTQSAYTHTHVQSYADNDVHRDLTWFLIECSSVRDFQDVIDYVFPGSAVCLCTCVYACVQIYYQQKCLCDVIDAEI